MKHLIILIVVILLSCSEDTELVQVKVISLNGYNDWGDCFQVIEAIKTKERLIYKSFNGYLGTTNEVFSIRLPIQRKIK